MSAQAQVETLPPESSLARGLVALEKYRPDPQVQGVLNRVGETRVNSRPTAQNATDLLGLIAEMKQVVHDRWDDLCADAHVHHKKLTTKRAEELRPLEEAEAKIKRLVGAFDEQERAKEADRLRKERERVEAEQRRVQEATAKELEEHHGYEPEEAKQAAEEMAAELPIPQPVVQRPAFQGASTRVVLKPEVVSILELIKAIAADPLRFPTTLISVNQTQLNNYVRAHGADVQIPGVKVSRVSNVYRR